MNPDEDVFVLNCRSLMESIHSVTTHAVNFNVSEINHFIHVRLLVFVEMDEQNHQIVVSLII